MENSLLQNCPICGQEVFFSGRYPKHVCNECQTRLSDSEGRLVYFVNTHVMGYGCQGFYRDTKDHPYDSCICYVDNVKCVAEEAHLGGIVVQVV